MHIIELNEEQQAKLFDEMQEAFKKDFEKLQLPYGVFESYGDSGLYNALFITKNKVDTTFLDIGELKKITLFCIRELNLLDFEINLDIYDCNKEAPDGYYLYNEFIDYLKQINKKGDE